jgi:hypothetical protein
MDEELKHALVKAGTKLGIGLALLAAVIGIRIVTATPRGVEAEIEELERIDRELAMESAAAPAAAEESAPSGAEPSMVSRLTGGLSEALEKSDAGPRDGDKLVSCRLGAGAQYMRADDCAMRGGRSTVFEDEP